MIRQRERDHVNGIENDTLVQGVPSDQIVTGVEDEDAGSSQSTSLERKIPKTPYFRNNLTALSQRYNVGSPLPASSDAVRNDHLANGSPLFLALLRCVREPSLRLSPQGHPETGTPSGAESHSGHEA